MKMTGLVILAIFGMAYAGKFAHHPDPTPAPYPAAAPIYTTDPVGPDTVLVRNLHVNGLVTFDKHACIFRYGEVQIRGHSLEVGADGSFEIERSTATTETGEQVNVLDGLVHVRILHPGNRAAISEALARVSRALGYYKDMTIEDFIQLIGTPLSAQGVIAITAGVISINGKYRNVNAGVLVVVGPVEEIPVGPVEEIPVGPGFLLPHVEPITEVVTEYADHETEIVYQSVTLTKTNTMDDFITVTSPVYRNAEITITDFVKTTVTVPEQEVIRSPLAGSIVLNTASVPTRTYITVTDTDTNIFISTGHNTVTDILQHFSTMFSFSTVTSIYPNTSTVTQTITRTSVSTTYTSNTVVTTMYVTTTVVITVNAPVPAPVPATQYGAPTYGGQ